jgi:hypothetical protein
MKLESYREIFKKLSSIKYTYHENPSSAMGAVPCGGIDRHDEGNSHFSQFYLIDFVMTGVEL